MMQVTVLSKSIAVGASLLVMAQFSTPAWSQSMPESTIESMTESAPTAADGVVTAHTPEDATQTAPADEAATGFLDSILALVGLGAGEPNADAQTDPATPVVAAEDAQAADPVRAVELIRLSDQQDVLERNFYGRVVARETADLAFPLGGTLDHFPAEEGATVAAGEVLAALDLAPFERAVERAEIELDQAERAFARAQALEERDVGSRTRAEDARSLRDLADVALREARDALEDATITAPYRALIAERLTANHVIVSPGTAIVRVHDISQMRVEIDVPERLVQRFPLFDQVVLHARLQGHAEPVDLTLVEFQAETQAVGQSYRFTLALPDMPMPGLLPGSSLTVTAAIPQARPSLMVPATAIAATNERDPYVMVFEPLHGTQTDLGTVRTVKVDVASANGTSFSVNDLPENTEIVGVGAHLLRDGQTVRRFTGLKVEE